MAEPTKPKMATADKVIVGAILVAMFLAYPWYRGSFDYALVNVGLNAHPCYRNGFGATFCGADAKRYRVMLNRAGIK